MGGSGGRYVPSGGPSPGALLKSAVSEEKRATYSMDLNFYLQGILSSYNDRDVEKIRTHLETIESALTKDGIGTIELMYGGSIKRHTYLNGLSDVDILAKIDNTTLVDASPQQVSRYFAQKLRERLPSTEISVGNLAVTVSFSDGHEVQILPALSTKTGLRISKSDGRGWSPVIRPERFAQQLTEVNQSKAGKVVPVIKLCKAINAQFEEDKKLSGYHVESLAIEAFKQYDGPLNYKDMLSYWFQYSSKRVLKPMQDSTGQSIHVDDNLGDSMSRDRQMVGAALERVSARMRAADEKASFEDWVELVGE